jgi:hypothetical protein
LTRTQVTGETNADTDTIRHPPWTFLSLTQALCPACPSKPSPPSPTLDVSQTPPPSPGLFGRFRSRNSNKLPRGTHRLPFSVDLPGTVTHAGKDFALPPSFTETGALCSVTYELAVHVRRGALSADTQCVSLYCHS